MNNFPVFRGMVRLTGRAVPILVVKGETMHPYPPEVCEHMKAFYDSLSEKDRRRYAAVEAEKLGHGGVEYIASVLGCDEKTIRQGRSDVQHLPQDEAEGRIRKKGGSQES